MSWDSGKNHGKRMRRGGGRNLRNTLYMRAVGCSSRLGAMGKFCRRPIGLGKHPKGRSLLSCANSPFWPILLSPKIVAGSRPRLSEKHLSSLTRLANLGVLR
ncbi:hypothetical protein [Roseobacter cerasinus]|uniref:hypothetical protein n=1 Tax=Roseobacter cerasinus TaxID=2602289 RepID=UPI0034D681A5